MDQFSQNDGASSLYRRRRSVKLFGVRLGPRRQVIYASLTIILSIFVNLIFLWPVSHFWALMLIAVSLSSVLLSDASRRTAMIGGLSAFAAAGAIYGLVGPAPPREHINRQWIVPVRQPTPANICLTQQPGKLPSGAKVVLIGDSAVLVYPGRATPILSVAHCGTASLYQNATGVLLNASVYDDYGTLLFRINNNQLQLVAGNAVYQERPASLASATIHGENGDELLHVDYLNPQTLRLRGVFACLHHPPVTITDAQPIPGVAAPSCKYGKPIEIP